MSLCKVDEEGVEKRLQKKTKLPGGDKKAHGTVGPSKAK
jgi:hypothetical protein